MRRRKPKPRGISQAALQAYAERERVLARLGFDSYPAYLDSSLWRDIRLRTIKKQDGRCYGCGRGGCRQVHHGDYREATLAGDDDAELYVVCDKCHRAVEFFCGQKIGPAEATTLLKKRREKNLAAPPAELRRLLDRDEIEKAS